METERDRQLKKELEVANSFFQKQVVKEVKVVPDYEKMVQNSKWCFNSAKDPTKFIEMTPYDNIQSMTIDRFNRAYKPTKDDSETGRFFVLGLGFSIDLKNKV